MSNPLSRFMELFAPFATMGIILVLMVVAIILLFHILFWGILLGAVLFAAAYIKDTFFTKKPKPRQGRIIEHKNE